MTNEKLNIAELELERGLNLTSFKFKRLYAITLLETIRSFPRFISYVPDSGEITIDSDEKHLDSLIRECSGKIRFGISTQVPSNLMSIKYIELLRFMVDFAILEENVGSYEKVFGEEPALSIIRGLLFYNEVSKLRFAFTRIDKVSQDMFKSMESEIVAKYIPKESLDIAPGVFRWLYSER